MHVHSCACMVCVLLCVPGSVAMYTSVWLCVHVETRNQCQSIFVYCLFSFLRQSFTEPRALFPNSKSWGYRCMPACEAGIVLFNQRFVPTSSHKILLTQFYTTLCSTWAFMLWTLLLKLYLSVVCLVISDLIQSNCNSLQTLWTTSTQNDGFH